MSDENPNQPNREGDPSFEDAWDALAGRSAKRTAVTLDVSLDLSDGRSLHEHLASVTELLVSHGVIVSATSVAMETTSVPDASGDWIMGSAVTSTEQGLTGHTEAERAAPATPTSPIVNDNSIARWAASGDVNLVKAMMLSAEYERAIAVSADPSGLVGSDLGWMLADHINRTLRDHPDLDPRPLLILPPSLASAVRPFLTNEVPGLQVHGYDEIDTGAQIECVAMLRCPVPPYDMPPEAPLPPAVQVSPEDMGEGADWNW